MSRWIAALASALLVIGCEFPGTVKARAFTTGLQAGQSIHYQVHTVVSGTLTAGKERVDIYSGSIQATQGRGGFGGDLRSMNPDAPASLNIATWLDLDAGGSLGGVSGFTKTGAGTLVVNGTTNVDATGATVIGVGDITLNGGNTIWNGPIALVNGSMFLALPGDGMTLDVKPVTGKHGREIVTSQVYDATIWNNDKIEVLDVLISG